MTPAPDSGIPFVSLRWDGPFHYSAESPHFVPGRGCSQPSLTKASASQNLYYVLGDHVVYGDRSLLYIGKTEDLWGRMKSHKWIADEWNVEVYVADVDYGDDCRATLDQVESLLIWAHQPSGNSSKIASPPTFNLRIWNEGRCPRLLPDISTAHPWFSGGRAWPPESTGAE